MKYCKNCGNEVLDEVTVCSNCGSETFTKTKKVIKEEKATKETKTDSKKKKEETKVDNSNTVVSAEEFAKVQNYAKTTRTMFYILAAIILISVIFFGVFDNFSQMGTYYYTNDISFTEEGETIHLSKLDSCIISFTRITFIKYIDSEKASEKVSTSANSKTYEEYYLDQGYKKLPGLNYYWKSYRYKRVSLSKGDCLYIKKDDDWVFAFEIGDNGIKGYYYTKKDLDTLCDLYNMKLKLI